jgi:hypothetical protein
LHSNSRAGESAFWVTRLVCRKIAQDAAQAILSESTRKIVHNQKFGLLQYI